MQNMEKLNQRFCQLMALFLQFMPKWFLKKKKRVNIFTQVVVNFHLCLEKFANLWSFAKKKKKKVAKSSTFRNKIGETKCEKKLTGKRKFRRKIQSVKKKCVKLELASAFPFSKFL